MAVNDVRFGTTMPQWLVNKTAKKAKAAGLKVAGKVVWRGVLVVDGTEDQVENFKQNIVPQTRFNSELKNPDRFVRD